MKTLFTILAALSVAVSLYGQEAAPSGVEELLSPDGNLSLKFTLTESGAPCYWLDFKNSNVILPSTMGFEFRGRKPEPKFGYGEKLVVRPYGDADGFYDGFSIGNVSRSEFDEVWEPVWGEESSIRNHYNEMAVTLEQDASGRSCGQ